MEIYNKDIMNWTDKLNSIPTTAVIKLAENGLDKITELTSPNNENALDFPTYETMWRFKYGVDNIWIENNIDKMRDIGFRVYDSDIFGIIFGVEDTNFEFYFDLWEPFYNAFHNIKEN